jgi:hypothetical protein
MTAATSRLCIAAVDPERSLAQARQGAFSERQAEKIFGSA